MHENACSFTACRESQGLRKEMIIFLNEDKPRSSQSNHCKWRKKLILLQETFAVVFDLSCCRTVREGTPTQRINFLWTCHTVTLCSGALVVIKNRPLPL